MFGKDEFRKYAVKHHGISSTVVDQYITSSMTPYIIEERQLNVAQMDVFSRLMMDRIIFLGTGIDDHVANIITAQLLFLESVDPKKDIQIYLNSPGVAFTQALESTIPCNISRQTLLQFVQVWQHLWEQFFCAQVQKENVLHYHIHV
jgi:hypothetical protein